MGHSRPPCHTAMRSSGSMYSTASTMPPTKPPMGGRWNDCVCTERQKVTPPKHSDDQLALQEWLCAQGLGTQVVLRELDSLGVEQPTDLCFLRPEEIDGLSLSLTVKHTLVTAIDATLDLSAWLSSWGLVALAGQIAELGVQTPEDMLDLMPEDIELLDLPGADDGIVLRLLLNKAIDYLDNEHSALAERATLLHEAKSRMGCKTRETTPPSVTRPICSPPVWQMPAGQRLGVTSVIRKTPLTKRLMASESGPSSWPGHNTQRSCGRTVIPSAGQQVLLRLVASECPF
jgi:hypothetical protein